MLQLQHKPDFSKQVISNPDSTLHTSTSMEQIDQLQDTPAAVYDHTSSLEEVSTEFHALLLKLELDQEDRETNIQTHIYVAEILYKPCIWVLVEVSNNSIQDAHNNNEY